MDMPLAEEKREEIQITKTIKEEGEIATNLNRTKKDYKGIL